MAKKQNKQRSPGYKWMPDEITTIWTCMGAGLDAEDIEASLEKMGLGHQRTARGVLALLSLIRRKPECHAAMLVRSMGLKVPPPGAPPTDWQQRPLIPGGVPIQTSLAIPARRQMVVEIADGQYEFVRDMARALKQTEAAVGGRLLTRGLAAVVEGGI